MKVHTARIFEKLGIENVSSRAKSPGYPRTGSLALKGGGPVAEELRKRRWKPERLEQRPKGDGEKVKMAERLRCETTMTLAWIAERLRMGTKTHLAHLLYWKQRDKMK